MKRLLVLALLCSTFAIAQANPDNTSNACKVGMFNCALSSVAYDILNGQPDAVFLEDLANMRSSAITQQQKEQVTLAERQRTIRGIVEDEKSMYEGDEVPSLRVHEAVMVNSTCMLLLTGNDVSVSVFSKRRRDCDSAIKEAGSVFKGHFFPAH